jgi:uncharacterized protein (TIGR02145 family)
LEDIFGIESSSSEEDYGRSSSGGGVNLSSGNGNLSSSGDRSLSSSSTKGVVYGATVSHGGKDYKTVVIGTQTWMTENLNYDAKGSVCYRNNPANCDKYGRLYDWATAMNINSKYINEFWNGSTQGICPSGWHIPNYKEWNILIHYADGGNGYIELRGDAYYSPTADKYLKAASGWNSINGEDKYGFSAMPGCQGFSLLGNPIFLGDDGNGGFWWTSDGSEGTALNLLIADETPLTQDMSRVRFMDHTKDQFISVRCLKNQEPSKSEIVYGATVSYEGEDYKTVVIGEQTWMARNLNYNATGSVCYGYDDQNCNRYGRLYNWATAMALDPSCNSSDCAYKTSPKHQGICPSGWHIPSGTEWNKLLRFVDNIPGTSSNPYYSFEAGKYLKATSEWNNYGNVSGNGEDKYGFSALPAGDYGNNGNWWSASEHGSKAAYNLAMYYDDDDVYGSNEDKLYMFSVRCLKD